MDKAADAFRTISEVADELDVPKHVLRFWEIRFPQIKPMKRGGGRRYYRPADLELLRGIRHLLHNEGYTIKGVQKILREQGVEQVKNSLLAATSPTTRSATTAAVPPPAAGRVKRRDSPTSGRSSRAGAPPRDRKAAIAMMIRELQSARDILAGKPAGRPAKAAPPRVRARR